MMLYQFYLGFTIVAVTLHRYLKCKWNIYFQNIKYFYKKNLTTFSLVFHQEYLNIVCQIYDIDPPL